MDWFCVVSEFQYYYFRECLCVKYNSFAFSAVFFFTEYKNTNFRECMCSEFKSSHRMFLKCVKFFTTPNCDFSVQFL
jgi:hypothetical protein